MHLFKFDLRTERMRIQILWKPFPAQSNSLNVKLCKVPYNLEINGNWLKGTMDESKEVLQYGEMGNGWS